MIWRVRCAGDRVVYAESALLSVEEVAWGEGKRGGLALAASGGGVMLGPR